MRLPMAEAIVNEIIPQISTECNKNILAYLLQFLLRLLPTVKFKRFLDIGINT